MQRQIKIVAKNTGFAQAVPIIRRLEFAGEQFATHRTPMGWIPPGYALSHIESGARVCSGKTEAQAYQKSVEKLKSADPAELRQAIEKAKKKEKVKPL